MADFTLSTTVVTPVKETLDHLAYQMVMECGTPTTPARITVLLRAVDASGEWRTDAETVRAVVEDVANPNTEDMKPNPAGPWASRVAYNAIGAILDAVITDADCATMGVPSGTTVRQMGEALIPKALPGSE